MLPVFILTSLVIQELGQFSYGYKNTKTKYQVYSQKNPLLIV